MGKTRYAYDTASSGEIENKSDTGLATDPTECDQGSEIRDDVVNPGRGPGGTDLEPQAGPERRFYVYYLRRPDKIDPLNPSKGQPFYIGKGCNCRYLGHRREAETLLHKPGRKSYKINIIHKLWKQTLDFEEDILFDNLSEEDAFALEIAAIEQYGRINKKAGCLANLTDGGEGAAGCVRSEETKERVRQAAFGRKHTPEAKQKLRDINLGKKQAPESIEKTRQGNLGRKNSPETIEKFRQANLGENNPMFGKKHASESIEKMSLIKLGKRMTPEAKEKSRQAHLGKRLTPEQKEHLRLINLGENSPRFGKKHTTETKEKMRQKRKWYWRLVHWDKIITDFIKRIKR